MPFCPVCRHELMPGVKKCPDCDIALIEELPETDLFEVELAIVGSYTSGSGAQEARKKLNAYGIESTTNVEMMSRNGESDLVTDGRVKVMVRREEAGWASRVLVER